MMGAGEAEVITKMMENHQHENRQQLSELRESTSEMAKAVSDLTATIARVEERHARQDDGLKRVGKQVDDHEARMRTVEEEISNLKSDRRAVYGGWKVIAVLGSFAFGLLTIGATVLPAVLSNQ